MGYYEDLPVLDINDGLEDAAFFDNSIVIDVRTPEEYREGHVPGALNIEAELCVRTNQAFIEEQLPDKSARVFMYCESGARSGMAAASLRLMGYRAENIGGFDGYTGPVES